MKRTRAILGRASLAGCCLYLVLTCLACNAGAADERFKTLADGTVQDLRTSLIWASGDNGSNISWSGAVEYCKNFTAGGHNDWRIPTSSELESLYGNTKKVQGQDYSGFIDVATEKINISAPYVWTNRRTSDNKAMAFGFNYGVTKRLKRGTGGNRRALPVRSAKQ